jgi:hypothetical protein
MTEQTPAGWHIDPFGRYELRYWDGTHWTEHVVSDGSQEIDQPVDAPEAPEATAASPDAGWYPDPTSKEARRYWDGTQWTEHFDTVESEGTETGTDPATTLPVGRPNKKVARQARKSGATANQSGGGTLFTEQVLVINQKAKVFGSTLGYAVFSQNGHQLGTIEEVRRDFGTKFSESLRGTSESKRTHLVRVVDMNGHVLLEMTRPRMGWMTMKAKLVVEGPGGIPIGQIAHESFGLGGSVASATQAGVNSASSLVRFGLGGLTGLVAGTAVGGIQDRLDSAVEGLDKVGHARFGLEADGQRLGSIHAEDTTQWDFNVKDSTDTEVARITKTWAGWAKERFTKADNYVVQMHHPLDEPLRSLVIAAALAIDVELKQKGQQVTGSQSWGKGRYK